MMKNGQPFAMAGLWETWTTPEGTPLNTCTIITTDANSLVATYHHRMPVILPAADIDPWLDHSQNPVSLQTLLSPYPSEQMTVSPF
jgi:putative SOS response-associated peptidase YedK